MRATSAFKRGLDIESIREKRAIIIEIIYQHMTTEFVTDWKISLVKDKLMYIEMKFS